MSTMTDIIDISLTGDKLTAQNQMLTDAIATLESMNQETMSLENEDFVCSLVLREEISTESRVLKTIKDTIIKIWEAIRRTVIEWYNKMADFIRAITNKNKEIHTRIENASNQMQELLNKISNPNINTTVQVPVSISSRLYTKDTLSTDDLIDNILVAMVFVAAQKAEYTDLLRDTLSCAESAIERLHSSDGMHSAREEWIIGVKEYRDAFTSRDSKFKESPRVLPGGKRISVSHVEAKDIDADNPKMPVTLKYTIKIEPHPRASRVPRSGQEVEVSFAQVSGLIKRAIELINLIKEDENRISDMMDKSKSAKDKMDKIVKERNFDKWLDAPTSRGMIHGVIDSISINYTNNTNQLARWQSQTLYALVQFIELAVKGFDQQINK